MREQEQDRRLVVILKWGIATISLVAMPLCSGKHAEGGEMDSRRVAMCFSDRPIPCPLPAAPRLSRGWYVAPILGQIADGVTTIRGIQSGNVHEGNPLQGRTNIGKVIAAKVVIVAVSTWMEHRFESRGHRRAAKVMAGVVTVLGGGAAAVNAGGGLR